MIDVRVGVADAREDRVILEQPIEARRGTTRAAEHEQQERQRERDARGSRAPLAPPPKRQPLVAVPSTAAREHAPRASDHQAQRRQPRAPAGARPGSVNR